MKKLLKDLIPQRALRLVEEREYKLRQLSPGAYDVLGPGTLGIPSSAIVDVKILKAPKPIFKCFRCIILTVVFTIFKIVDKY